MLRLLLPLLLSLATLASAASIGGKKDLRIVFIDVEGGQATLFAAPSGESLLIDSGWPGNDGRDSRRIKEAMKSLGLKKIDYFVMTHYHLDHVGGISDLTSRVEIGTFVDKGANVETDAQGKRLSEQWAEAIGKGQHLTVKAGDKIPVKGLDIRVVSADGNTITGSAGANPACADVQPKEVDPTENARSLGMVITFQKTRILDLGDLTWNKEMQLACPGNLLGKIDLFIATHHGFDSSNNPALVKAIEPRVAVVDNGARKGAVASVINLLKSVPSIKDVWQLHFAVAGAKEGNTTDPFIANLYEQDAGHPLEAAISPDGKITLYNPRNKFQKTY